MTEILPIDGRQGPTPKGQGPTGPTTPEGKRRCALNAYRHGFTGRLTIITAEEQQAYDEHSQITLAALAPANSYERSIAQSIADARWRLTRARSIESSIFAMGMRAPGAAVTGVPQVDDGFSQARTWIEDSRNLQLLTIYEQRIQRAIDKNLAYLETLRTKRQATAQEDMRQAKLIYQLAQAEGKPYQPEAYFTAAPPPRESVFSTPEVARALGREILLDDATRHKYSSPKLTVAQALAFESPASGDQPARKKTAPTYDSPVKLTI